VALSDAHTRDYNPVAFVVRFRNSSFEIYAPLPVVQDVITDDTVQIVRVTHIVARTRSWRTIITG